MVEFAAVLLPLILIVVGIIQFGLLYGAHVTLTNAAREGARAGTIYVYDQNHTAYWNDAHRCGAILEAINASFGLLDETSPHFATTMSAGACATPTSTTLVNGDLTVSYCATASGENPCPDPGNSLTNCVTDSREGCLVRVEIRYHSDIVVPLIGDLLATDGGGRFLSRAMATMVVN
ncbi:MAG TPA: TadE family protein [Candidatus Limnocylindria bacterium]|jgi:Flp pilus assembly protein TadG|nr:TadE family protein [Candidatus Limnocylindria bacterium]